MSTASLRRARPRKYRIPRGFAGTVTPPFERVLALGRHHDGFRFVEAGVMALAAHGLLVLLAIFGKPTPRDAPPPKKKTEIVVTAPPPPPPKVEEPKPPPPPEAPKAPKPRLARSAPPPPTPKQAGKVVAAAADPNAPVDMTGFSMPVGEGKYEGGPVSAKAPPPAPTPVAEPPRPKANVAAAVGPSLAKPPGPARHDWTCTWPDDEQDSDLRDAKVSIRVAVSVDGAADSVEVLSSPKPSFAEAATHCALAEAYRPALDTAGNRMAALTPPFNVHFVR